MLSSLAFALIHLPKDGDPRALATFFPGLLFGWMRSATGSILASTVTHAASNILVRFLELVGDAMTGAPRSSTWTTRCSASTPA